MWYKKNSEIFITCRSRFFLKIRKIASSLRGNGDFLLLQFRESYSMVETRFTSHGGNSIRQIFYFSDAYFQIEINKKLLTFMPDSMNLYEYTTSQRSSSFFKISKKSKVL